MKNLIRLLTFLLLLGCKENSNKNNNISNKEDLELSEINESKKLKSETIFNVFKENNSSYYYNNYIIIEDKSSTNTYILKKDNISLGKIELNKSYDGPGFSFFINELSSTLSNIIVEATADIGTSWYFSVIINNNRISNTFYIEEPRADSETTSINDFLKVSVDKDMLEYKFVKSKIARYSKIPENFNSDNSYLYFSRKINEDKNKIKDNFSLNGVWKSDCLNGNAKIEFNKEYVNLELIYNQIYINLEKIDESNNTISYKLKEIPKDKGSLGAKLDWENFMNESMVLEIKKRDDSKINFKWLGFYNSKTKKREFLENDFLSELNKEIEIEITLEKCE
ncbi:hypothetical protein JJC04_02200 [Flavobacterium covae]|nr:hypothetical protein [Flavobacterium covae]QYS91613.1 hypothetical protein JJC04_02200 [Flavobacterium covae]